MNHHVARVSLAIERASISKSKRLDLSYSKIDSIPSTVFELSHLEALDLRHTFIRKVPAELRELSSLKELDLRDCSIESVPNIPGLIMDWLSYLECKSQISPENIQGLRFSSRQPPEELFTFPRLEFLDFAGANLDAVPRQLVRMPCLERLDLSRNDLHSIPDLIFDLSKLKSLLLCANSIAEISTRIRALGELVELDIHKNPIEHLNEALQSLQRLRRLDISALHLASLPDWLLENKNLTHLWAAGNGFRNLSESIRNLESLEALNLAHNSLEELPDAISELKELRALILEGNPFNRFPLAALRVRSLTYLNLGAGEDRGSLREVPAEIAGLDQLEILDLEGQPIEVPPREVVLRGIDAIRGYFRQLGVGQDYLSEAKLIVVGEPGAGKTSLTEKILDPEYRLKPHEKSTEGIDVREWCFPTTLRVGAKGNQKRVEQDFRVHIWDFGGQEIYHATHQFFLTRRSVYVLVADIRKEDTDFHYWLNVIELLSDGSPLVVVKNEKQDRRRDVNEAQLRGRFANLKEILATNLETNRGLEEVVRAVRAHLEGLRHIGSPLPQTWKKVREALEKDPRNHIDMQEFIRICAQNGFTAREDVLQLGGYLHDLGICLHFQEDPILSKTVILKPKWGTDAVYKVLDNRAVMEARGHFSRRDLDSIWSEPKYANMRDELLQLMVKFQLCYQVAPGSYLAPQLLDPTAPSYEWRKKDNLVITYQYDFMPKGILRRFMVATHNLILSQTFVWRDGVILGRNDTKAEVIEDYLGRAITVRVTGKHPRDLMTIVDHELEKIHRGYPRLKYDKLIPCNCSICATTDPPIYFSYDVLTRFALHQKHIQCHASFEHVDAEKLLDTAFVRRNKSELRMDASLLGAHLEDSRASAPPAPPATEVFVSYAHGGTSGRTVDRIEECLLKRGIPLLRDKSTIRYKQSIQDFMRRLGRGRCIIVVLSRKYLESQYCMFELAEIAERGEFLKRVFPVVLDDADIYDSVDRVRYVEYWESKIKELDAAMKKVEQSNLHGIREDLDLFRRIRTVVAQLMSHLGNMNAATTEDQQTSDFRELVSDIEAELAK